MGKRHKRYDTLDIPGAGLCALAVINHYNLFCDYAPTVYEEQNQRCNHYLGCRARVDEVPLHCSRLNARQAEIKIT